MGYTRHDAIIVTSWQEDAINAAHAKAIDSGCTTTEIVKSPINAYWSFLVAPDGSNEGWPDSDLGDEQRKNLVDWLRQQGDTNSQWPDWCEVSYGDDENQHAYVKQHNKRSDGAIDFDSDFEDDEAGPAS